LPEQLPPVKTGLDVLVASNFKRLQGKRIGLLGNPCSIDRNFCHLLTHCLEKGINVLRLFGAEHGFLGNAHYMEAVDTLIDPKSKLPIISIYGHSRASLFIRPEYLEDLDVLVCDLQDIGSRYYTFAYSVAFAMQSCQQAGIACMVLDRPNPIGGLSVEGNEVLPDFFSFVGEYPLANRHGLTLGELANLFKAWDKNTCDLEVVWMENWKRNYYFSDTKLPWVLPSPNMATETTTLVYPGTCLLEGTNLSEGRGTTRPFEILGAPYITDPDHFANLAHSCQLPATILRPCWFTPLSDKYAGKLCGGLQIHITNREQFLPLRTAVAILWAARHFEGFAWRTETYEFVSDRLAIDLLFGDDVCRKMLEDNATVDAIMSHIRKSQAHFETLRQSALYVGYNIV
jgi:uncharacterized protein YbbC (DUF1343 family)